MQATHYNPTDREKLPSGPGIYFFYNAKETLIYVGKAKNIKKRVNSYFLSQGASSIKTRKMVAQVQGIGFTLVNSEHEALLLENNLIKENQPRYNVLLKDGKTYPYLCITNERFPRLIATRERKAKLGQYFGPFTSSKPMQQIQELIADLYLLRTCTYHLSEANIAKKKFKVCLAYHIGKCLGPCEGLQTEAAYLQNIEEVVQLLKGHFGVLKKKIKTNMLAAAQAHDFEKAQSYKKKLTAIANYQAKSLITRSERGELDVIGLVAGQKGVFINYLRISDGMIIFAQTIEIQKKLDEEDTKLMGMALYHFREKAQSKAREVLANLQIASLPKNVNLIIPQIGDKKKLVELAVKNAFFFKKEIVNKKAQAPKTSSRSTLIMLQQDLRLKEVPLHIECFDNSNLQGTHPVAAMVCFKKNKFTTYRHYHIKQVQGIDDFASMHEVITRRYKAIVEKKEKLPDLIVVDGGKGQLSAATQALKEIGIYGQVAIVGIAKRLEAIYYPEDSYPHYINKKSPSLQLLQKIRNEAHRFAVSFHQNIRSKDSLKSELEGIKGIGASTIEKLITHFGSVPAIKKATTKEMGAKVGKHKTILLQNYFNTLQS